MGFLENQTILVAGGAGCAGLHVIQDILERHPTVRLRATFYHHTEPVLQHPRVEWRFCELQSVEACREAARGCAGAVMVAAHTAGAGAIAQSPTRHVTDNAVMNVQELEAFHAEGVRRVLYVGSASLYQEFDGAIREDELDLNLDPHPAYFGYGWVVRFTEKLCRYWHETHGMEIIMVRAANLYGPYAKFDPARSNFIPALIRKAVEKMDPFEVWGSGEVTRDVLYATDFARAAVMLLDNEAIRFDVFNLCSGVQTRVSDVVKWALQAAHHAPREIVYQGDRPTTISFRAFDHRKLKQQTGWEPQVSPEEGIRRTTEWWIENRGSWTK